MSLSINHPAPRVCVSAAELAQLKGDKDAFVAAASIGTYYSITEGIGLICILTRI